MRWYLPLTELLECTLVFDGKITAQSHPNTKYVFTGEMSVERTTALVILRTSAGQTPHALVPTHQAEIAYQSISSATLSSDEQCQPCCSVMSSAKSD